MASSPRRQASIFVNGTQVEATAKNITAAFRQASNELANMVVGGDDYIKKLEEVRGLDATLKQHRDAVRGVEQGWNLAKGGLGDFIGIAAGAFTVDAIIGYGKELFGVASNMELMDKKAKTVFGETLPQVTSEADRNARAMGLTNSEYIAAAANIQDLLVPMGFQRKEAADISTQLTNLSGALSEWSAGQHTAKEVSEILSKSLLGERDALNSLGIDIKQAEVDSELYARGLEKLTGEAKKQAEATVTLDLILRKSTDAQQAFAEGSDSMARRSAELSARMTDIKETLANALIPIFERLLTIVGPIIETFGDLVSGIDDLINPAEAASKAFAKQAETVDGLEKNINPLLTRYDELTGKTTLTKDEQNELRKIIDQVSAAVPSAITEFDKYGRALSLNTDAARAFISAEKERLKVVGASAISENEKKLQALKNEQKRLQDELNKGTKITTTGSGGGGPIGGNVAAQEVSLSQEEKIKAQQRLKELEFLDERNNRTGLIVGYEAEIARLRGDNLDKLIKDTPPEDPAEVAKRKAEAEAKEKERRTKESQAAADKAQKQAETEAQKAREKQDKLEKDLQDHLKRVQDIVQKNQDIARIASLDADEQEVERIRLKYQKEIEQVQSKFEGEQKVKDAVAELEAQRDAEIAQTQADQREAKVDEEIAAYQEDQTRINDAKRLFLEEQAAADAELKDFQAQTLLSDKELELASLQEHYANLLKLAEQYGLDTTKLKEGYSKKQSDIEKAYADKTTKDQIEAHKARLAALQSTFTSLGDLTVAFSDLIAGESERSSELQKVATLAKIAFDTAAAISSLVAASNANPTNAVTFGAAGAAQYIAGIVQIISNIAQAKKILQGAPKVQQKAEGSYLTVTGQTDNRQYYAKAISAPTTGMLPGQPVLFTSTATGAPVLASERGAEYFVAAKDLSNPYVANLVRMIDNITTTGAVPQFADGGTNPSGALPPAAESTTPPPSFDPAVMLQLAQGITTLNALLASGIVAIVPDKTITDINKRFKVIDDASGGYFS